MSMNINLEPNLSPHEFVTILETSGLAERRPVNNHEVIKAMLDNASIIVTARSNEGRLIGVSRAISDFSYCTYLSDLAVDKTFQKQGIGKKLIEATHEKAGLGTTLILLSAPAAVDYYPRIGMKKHESCWIVERIE